MEGVGHHHVLMNRRHARGNSDSDGDNEEETHVIEDTTGFHHQHQPVAVAVSSGNRRLETTEPIRLSIEEDEENEEAEGPSETILSAILSSRDSPSSQPSSIQAQINRDRHGWFRSTLHLRASQETDPYPSDSSYDYDSGGSSSSGDIYFYNHGSDDDDDDDIIIMDAADDSGPAYAHQGGAADFHPMDFDHGVNHNRAGEWIGAHDPSTMLRDGGVSGSPYHPVAFDHDASVIPSAGTYHQPIVGGPGANRGPVITLRRGRMPRPAKRTRAQYEEPEDDDDDHDYDDDEEEQEEDVIWTRTETRKRRKRAPAPTVQRAEVHRRNTSLRDRLTKGIMEPQNVGMRTHKLRKAEAAAAKAAEARAARNRPREFLVPVDPGRGFNVSPYSRRPAADSDEAINNSMIDYNNDNNNFPNNNNNNHSNDNDNDNDAPRQQPNPHIAYKSTPVHQLHFAEELVAALKKNKVRWEGRPHSEGRLVFVVARLVGGDVADMRVFGALQDATADALHMMATEHPEAFARLRTTATAGGGEDEIKAPRTERVSSVIREITAPAVFERVPAPAPAPGLVDTNPDLDLDTDVDTATAYGSTPSPSLFLALKPEDPELPPRSRIADAAPYINDRGEMLLPDAPEPVYVFGGRWAISPCSFGLKMEAPRRADGAAVRISVHLKNLRRPARG
ncbi:hypothetical protein F5Y14DRAFT_459253 [Nemania sp. NC0429]|nr:hypothetical protein F5Y14DRAFT_459253 [Nemania sp. NC0429]